jgi:hypothetical protein
MPRYRGQPDDPFERASDVEESIPAPCKLHPETGQTIYDLAVGWRCSSCLRRLPDERPTGKTPRSMIESMKRLGIKFDESKLDIDERL